MTLTFHSLRHVWRRGLVAATALLLAATSQSALAAHPGSEMAMRWWNSLNAEQMVAALYGDRATAAQAAAAKKMYADLDAVTEMRVIDAARLIYGMGRFTSVGEWWESLDCRKMRIAAGDGNTADSSSAFCAHYPGTPFAKILGDAPKGHVDKVGMALLGRSAPGTFLLPAQARAYRWWNSLNGDQMVAALFGTTATAGQMAQARKMYSDLDQETKERVDAAAAEIYGSGGYVSVGAWWETLDCRKMRIAAGDGNTADSSSPFCAHYPRSGAAKILKAKPMEQVDKVGMALLRRSNPGVFPTPTLAYAMRWWNSLNGEQMVKALHGAQATRTQEAAAKKMYGDLDDATKYRVNATAREIYGAGRYESVGLWWEVLDCRKMRIAAGDGNVADSMSIFCAHYPDSASSKILTGIAKAQVDKVGMALLGRSTPGMYPTAYEIPFFPAADGMAMREGFARILNRGTRSVDVSIQAIDDMGMTYGPVTLTIGARAVAHFNSDDLEMGNAMKGLSGGVGSGTGDWRLVLTSRLPLETLAYIRTSDGFVTSMNDVAPYTAIGHGVVFLNPVDNMNQRSSLRIVNLSAMETRVRILGEDDSGAVPGSAVELHLPGNGARTLSAQELEQGSSNRMADDALLGALGDGMGKWRLLVNADGPIKVISLLESPTGNLTNLSSVPAFSPAK